MLLMHILNLQKNKNSHHQWIPNVIYNPTKNGFDKLFQCRWDDCVLSPMNEYCNILFIHIYHLYGFPFHHIIVIGFRTYQTDYSAWLLITGRLFKPILKRLRKSPVNHDLRDFSFSNISILHPICTQFYALYRACTHSFAELTLQDSAKNNICEPLSSSNVDKLKMLMGFQPSTTQ